MLALAVAARASSRVFRGGAAVGGMFFSTMPTVYLTFACFSSVFITIASIRLSGGADLIDELKVFKFLVVRQALPH